MTIDNWRLGDWGLTDWGIRLPLGSPGFRDLELGSVRHCSNRQSVDATIANRAIGNRQSTIASRK
jgi:hypothetical protein